MLFQFQRLAAAIPRRFRRGLSTAGSSSPWAMIYQTKVVRSPSPRSSIELAEPPIASHLLVPDHLVSTRRRPDLDTETMGALSGMVRATSGDGFLLLDFHDGFGKDVAFHRFICNPLSGELFRLTEIEGTKKAISFENPGILTQSDRPHDAPGRYAVAELDHDGEKSTFVMRRLLSEKGEWEKLLGLPSPLPLARRMDVDQEVLAFNGRLWWVDVSWGAISADPFSDRPDLRFVQLPRGSVTAPVPPLRILGRYRRMGVSEGRLRYAELSEEDTLWLRLFRLDDDGSGWTLERKLALGDVWEDGLGGDIPWIGVIDPLDARMIYLTTGNNVTVGVDMEKKKIASCAWLGDGIQQGPVFTGFLKPCVLPPWLGSSQIPSLGTSSRQLTLADILVRLDRRGKK